MINKHFFKSLILFAGMILLGMVGVFVVNYFDTEKPEAVQTEEEGCKTGEVC
ncbi:MAG: hypothetical protein WD991_01630 [Candidatus Paceibacterota bacterium]